MPTATLPRLKPQPKPPSQTIQQPGLAFLAGRAFHLLDHMTPSCAFNNEAYTWTAAFESFSDKA
jgi:hypothetical protein